MSLTISLFTLLIGFAGFYTAVVQMRPRKPRVAPKLKATKCQQRRRVERMEHECLDESFLRMIRSEGFLNHHRDCSGCEKFDPPRNARMEMLWLNMSYGTRSGNCYECEASR